MTRALPTRRWAKVVGAVCLALWGVVAWFAYQFVLDDARSQPGGQPGKASMMVVGILLVLLMIVLVLARAVSDEMLTYTADTIRFHAGERKTIRWARIARIDRSRMGREMSLLLKGNDRVVPVPGTRWLTDQQRAELVREWNGYRSRTRRQGTAD